MPSRFSSLMARIATMFCLSEQPAPDSPDFNMESPNRATEFMFETLALTISCPWFSPWPTHQGIAQAVASFEASSQTAGRQFGPQRYSRRQAESWNIRIPMPLRSKAEGILALLLLNPCSDFLGCIDPKTGFWAQGLGLQAAQLLGLRFRGFLHLLTEAPFPKP